MTPGDERESPAAGEDTRRQAWLRPPCPKREWAHVHTITASACIHSSCVGTCAGTSRVPKDCPQKTLGTKFKAPWKQKPPYLQGWY